MKASLWMLLYGSFTMEASLWNLPYEGFTMEASLCKLPYGGFTIERSRVQNKVISNRYYTWETVPNGKYLFALGHLNTTKL